MKRLAVIAVLCLIALGAGPPTPRWSKTPPSPQFASLPIRLETPASVHVTKLVNPWAGYSPKPGCNCVMCQTIRRYGSQKYAAEDVPFCPTPLDAARAMVDVACLTPADVLYDLGSGDGRLLILAAQAGARAVGVDTDRRLVDVAKRNADANHVADRVAVYERDAAVVDLSEATVVTLYQDPAVLLKFLPNLQRLNAGTRIVSYAHPLPGIGGEPCRVVDDTPIYRYVVSETTTFRKQCGPSGCSLVPFTIKAIVSAKKGE